MVAFDFRSFLPLSLGRVVATPGAIAAMDAADTTPMPLLVRHASGDWGDVDEEDARENELSVIHGHRVMSAYILRDKVTKVWIITEADRSSTTILLPSEY